MSKGEKHARLRDKLLATRERLAQVSAMARIPAHMVWDRQPFYRIAMERHGAVKGIPDIRCFFLQSCLRSLDRLEGDVAECGVRNGRSALFMLEALEVERRFFLFDSFEGLSDPLPADEIESVHDTEDGRRRFGDTDLDAVKARFAPFGAQVALMQGWIPERFPEVVDRKFCLVHLDVDLYEPTRAGLEFFYERLVPGGMLVCDDYGSAHYPGARLALDEFFAERPETPVELPQGQAFIVKA